MEHCKKIPLPYLDRERALGKSLVCTTIRMLMLHPAFRIYHLLADVL
jgi:hypothetical protein